MKVKPPLPWKTQDVRDARVTRYRPKRAANREWNQFKKEVCCSQQSLTELEIWSVLTSDMEMQNLEFTLLVFSLVLVKYFLIMLFFLPFWMVMYILCYSMLEICDLVYHFDFRQITVKRMHDFERLCFGFLNSADTVIDYWDFWRWTKCILHYDMIKSLWRPESGIWSFEWKQDP